MTRRLHGVAIGALLALALLPAAARAAGTTTIDFNTIPPGENLSEQYASVGVHFGSWSTFGLPRPPEGVECGGEGASPGINGRAANIACKGPIGEFDTGANMAFEFEDPRKSLGFTLKSTLVETPIQGRVVLYNIAHDVLRTVPLTLNRDAVTPVDLAPRAQADIAYVQISFDLLAQPSGQFVLVDDLHAPLEDGRTPQYSLAISQPAVDVYEGSTGTVPLSVRRFGGSVGGVSFSAGPLPSAITGVQFSPNPVSGRDPATMKISLAYSAQGDRQVPVSIASSGAPGVGTGVVTSGVVTVHPLPVLSMSRNPGDVHEMVPGCADADPAYFQVHGGYSGRVMITAQNVSGSTLVASSNPVYVDVRGDGDYPIPYPWRTNGDGTDAVRYKLTPDYATPITGDAVFRSKSVSVASISPGVFPEATSALTVRGSFPAACPVKFLDGLGQEYKVIDRAVDNGVDVVTIATPAGFTAVTAGNGLSVRAPDGHEITRTPPIAVQGFRNTYGMRNANSGAGAGSTLFPWADFEATYGDDDAEACVLACVRDPLAVHYWEDWVAKAKKNTGLCYGYSVMALRFRGAKQVQQSASAYQAGATKAYDITDFSDGTAIKRDIVRWHYSQYDKAFQEATKRPFAGPGSMAERVKQWKDQARAEIRTDGGALTIIYQGTAGHAVVAYRIQDNPDGGFTLTLADPNAPYMATEETDQPTRDAALASNTIVVKGDGTWSGASLGWKGDLTSLMFPYNWPTSNANLPNSFSLASALDSTVTAITTGGKDTLNPDGTPLKGAPVTLQPDFGGTGEPSYILDPGRTYEMTLRGSASGDYRFSDLGRGAQAIVTGASTKPGQEDHVTVTPGQAQLGFEPGGDSSGVTLSLVDAPSGKVRHTADITTTAKKGAEDTAKLSGSSLSIAHDGAPASLSVALGSVGAGLPSGVTLAPIRVGRGERLELKPGTWGALNDGVGYTVRNAKGKVLRKGKAKLRATRAVAFSGLKAVAKGTSVTITGKVTKAGTAPVLATTVQTLGAGGKVKATRSGSLRGKAIKNGRFTLKVKVPKLKRGTRIRVTATLLDEAAGLGSVRKTASARAR